MERFGPFASHIFQVVQGTSLRSDGKVAARAPRPTCPEEDIFFGRLKQLSEF